MVWLIRSQLEGLLVCTRLRSLCVIPGEKRDEVVITDDLSIAFQPSIVSSG